VRVRLTAHLKTNIGNLVEVVVEDEPMQAAEAIRAAEAGLLMYEKPTSALLPGDRIRFSKTVLEELLRGAEGDDSPEGTIRIDGVFVEARRGAPNEPVDLVIRLAGT
jgi:hypothetical protein